MIIVISIEKLSPYFNNVRKMKKYKFSQAPLIKIRDPTLLVQFRVSHLQVVLGIRKIKMC